MSRQARVRDLWVRVVPAYLAIALVGAYDLVLFGSTTQFNISDDLFLLTYPSVIHYLQTIRAEGFTLWDPANFTGVPHLGTGIATPFNPINYLVLVLSPEVVFAVNAIFFAVLAGGAMYFLLRHVLGYPALPAFFGGLIYQMLPISWRIYHPFEVHMRFPLAFFPLMVAGLTWFQQTGDRRYAIYSALAVTAGVAVGTPLLLPVLVLALLVCASGEVFERESTGHVRGLLNRTLGSWATVVGLSVLLSAAALLPFLVAFFGSARPAGGRGHWSIVVELMTAFERFRPTVRPNLAGMSLLPIIVALAAAGGLLRHRTPGVRRYVYPIGLLLLVLTPLMPVLSPVLKRVPVLGGLSPVTYLFFVDFMLAVAAAAGLAWWLTSARPSWMERIFSLPLLAVAAWMIAFAFAIGAVSAVRPREDIIGLFTPSWVGASAGADPGAGHSMSQWLRLAFQTDRWGIKYPSYFFGSRQWLVLLAALGQAAGIVWLLQQRQRGGTRGRGLVLAGVLGTAAVAFNWYITGPSRSLSQTVYAETPVSAFIRGLRPWERIAYVVDPLAYHENEHQLFEAAPLVFGAKLPNGFAHITPGAVMRLLYASEAAGPQASKPPAGSWVGNRDVARFTENEGNRVFLTNPDSRVLDLLGVAYVVSPEPVHLPHLTLVLAGGVVTNSSANTSSNETRQLYVYQNARSVPRTFLASRCVQQSPSRILESIAQGQTPLFGTVFVEESGAGTCADRAIDPGAVAGRAEIVEYRSSRVIIDVQPTQPAMLVLTDAYSPEWRAYVDGRPRPIVRVDGAFRGVRVERGDHVVGFVYRPWSFYIGVAISVLGLAWSGARLVVRSGRDENRPVFPDVTG